MNGVLEHSALKLISVSTFRTEQCSFTNILLLDLLLADNVMHICYIYFDYADDMYGHYVWNYATTNKVNNRKLAVCYKCPMYYTYCTYYCMLVNHGHI